MLLIIFFIVGVCPFWGFRSADILVSSAFDHSAATLAFCSVLTVRRPGRAGSGGRAGRAGRAAEGRGGGFGRSCRAVDGEAGRGGTGRLSRGRRRSCRSCRSCRGGAGRRFWAVVPGGGWRGRTRRNRSVESGAAEVVPGLLFRAAVPGGGGVSDGGAGLAVSGGRAGRRRLCRTVALGGGGVGRWRSRWTEDGETERGWAGGRGRPPLPHACRWSVPVSVSVPSRKSDVRRGKTAPKLVFARTKAYL